MAQSLDIARGQFKPNYRSPGVYRLSQRIERRDIQLVRTDVAGFVGFAERGPLPSPDATQVDPKALAIRLTSWKEFLVTFGGFIRYGYLAYAVRAFFDNGGTTCYVVRVAATHHSDWSQQPRVASFVLPGTAAAVQVAHLTKAVAAGQTDLVLNDARALSEGDLVAVEGDGVTEFAMIVARLDDTKVRLGRRLAACHKVEKDVKKGVWKYAPALIVTAKSKGSWGNRIRLSVTPLTADGKEFALRVTVEQGLDRSRAPEEEFYRRLSLVKGHPNYAPQLIEGVSQLIRVQVRAPELLLGVKGQDKEQNRISDGPLALGPVWLQGGRDGLKGVTVQDFTGGPTDSAADMRGLRLLEEIDEVAILCAPDAVFAAPAALVPRPEPPHDPCAPRPEQRKPDPVAEDPTAVPPALEALSIYQAMLAQCERLRDRVAIIDPPARLAPPQVRDWHEKYLQDAFIPIFLRFAALYYPWLHVADPLGLEGPNRQVPPSGHVAGIYARIDNQFGVQHPPANAPLEFVVDVVEDITSLQQEDLNPIGINAIRAFPGRGIRVWGARSLAGPNDSDWQFIHVRRLMSMIEESVEDSTQWAVFEPNDDALRRTLVHSLSVFLETIWRTGGLKGNVPAEGFYVKCDDTNNPPAVIAAGQIVCRVGVAVAAPMEFLVFEIRQTAAATEIVEP